MTEAAFRHWEDVAPDDAGAVQRRTIAGDGAALKHIAIPAGTRAGRHSHPHEQFVMILEGGGTITCEAGPVTLRPGTVIHFPPDAWHTAEFSVDTVLIEVNIR